MDVYKQRAMHHQLVGCRIGLIDHGTAILFTQEDIHSPGLVYRSLYHEIIYGIETERGTSQGCSATDAGRKPSQQVGQTEGRSWQTE